MKRDRQPTLALVAIGVAAVVVLMAGVTALFAGDADVPADGARVHLDGVATVARAGGASESLSDGDVVRAGDEVEVTDGTAVLELADGGTVEARAGRAEVADTKVGVGAPIRLLAGDLLAAGPTGLAVEAAGTVVTLEASRGEAAARIRRELAVTTATYRGAVAVESAGQEQEVPALRQLSVASVGRLSSGEDPLRYDVADLDPWDLRYLGAAIDLTRQLEALSRAFTSQGLARVAAGDYETLLPRLAEEPAFDEALVTATPNRSAGETLVGAAIAALGGGDDFPERWSEVFGFRDDGATWGLVALDQEVSEGSVLDDVQLALARSVAPASSQVAAAPATGSAAGGSAPSPAGSGSTPGSTSGAPSGTTTPPPAGSPTTAPPPPTPPVETTLPPVPPPPPPDGGGGEELLGGLLEPVHDLLGGLVGG